VPVSPNFYTRSPSVGSWGGVCTCPDGQRYHVGDLMDGCADGPQSLACFRGTPSDCIKVSDSARDGMAVKCGELPEGEAPAKEAPSRNVYAHSGSVGGWGGYCTCPDGQRYNVGDRKDGCARGSQSLACFGGTPGECIKVVDASREGMQVNCAGA